MNTKDPLKDFQAILMRERVNYDYTSLFERFLEYVLYGFDPSGIKIPVPYDRKEGEVCLELMQEWLQVVQYKTRNGGWYDLLGEIYMNSVAGNGKKSMTGQFFTPMHICDFMAKITEPGENGGETVMDTACGSGRMLLAAHSVHPRNYCYAQDLDRLCCLMTACNFLVHGVVGEVVWGDGLDPNDFRCGWKINETLALTGLPTVRRIDRHESLIGRANTTIMAEMISESKKNDKVIIKAETKKSAKPAKKNVCVMPSLFDFE